jgi:hypothetical protein
MTAKQKRDYLQLARSMPADWLADCVADPSAHMTRTHRALCRLALRKPAKRK